MLMIMVSSSWYSKSTSPGSRATPSDRRRTPPSSLRSWAARVSSRDFSSCEPSLVSAANGRLSFWLMAASCHDSSGRRALLELDGDTTHRIVLAQRVPLPVLWPEDAGQIVMVVEAYAKQVIGLPLHRFGPRPDVEQRRHDRVGGRNLHSNPQTTVLGQRQQVNGDFEALGRDALGQVPADVGQVVHSAQIGAHLVAVGFQGPHQLEIAVDGAMHHLLAVGNDEWPSMPAGSLGRLGRRIGLSVAGGAGGAVVAHGSGHSR